MATKKKDIKVKDLKPNKDAKGGAARQQGATRGNQGGSRNTDGARGLQGRTKNLN
ncbi:hypothetical protein BH18VER2_BH18VER2_06880 [soil metagenome]